MPHCVRGAAQAAGGVPAEMPATRAARAPSRSATHAAGGVRKPKVARKPARRPAPAAAPAAEAAPAAFATYRRKKGGAGATPKGRAASSGSFDSLVAPDSTALHLEDSASAAAAAAAKVLEAERAAAAVASRRREALAADAATARVRAMFDDVDDEPLEEEVEEKPTLKPLPFLEL